MLGVTISAITGSENAMEKAQQARTENDKGAMKDSASLKAVTLIQEYMDKKYVTNQSLGTGIVTAGDYVASQIVGTEGGYTYAVSTKTLTVTDTKGNTVTGTILDNGNINWGERPDNSEMIINNNTIDVNTLNVNTIGQYYGTVVTRINNVDYALYYVDYAGDFGDEGTIYLKALTGENFEPYSNQISDLTQKTRAVEIMSALNPDWADKSGVTNYDSMSSSELSAALLCNPSYSVWADLSTTFENIYGEGNVNYVIGAPSTEMFAKSINQAGGLIGTNAVDSKWFSGDPYFYSGYVCSITGKDTTSSSDYEEKTLSSTQTDTLTNAQKAMYYSGEDYQWLASPAYDEDHDSKVNAVFSDGTLGSLYYNYGYAACPLVSLKSGVNLVPITN